MFDLQVEVDRAAVGSGAPEVSWQQEEAHGGPVGSRKKHTVGCRGLVLLTEAHSGPVDRKKHTVGTRWVGGRAWGEVSYYVILCQTTCYTVDREQHTVG